LSSPDHRWYIRFYVNKLNSGGLPAVYLYLSGKSTPVVLELQFTLRLATDLTEILTYSFGDGAKYEGFGKTLREPLVNAEKLTEVTVAVEIQSMVVYKTVAVRLPPRSMPSGRRYQPDGTNFRRSYLSTSAAGFNSLARIDTFQVR